jgi:drug/metabolite transporter (DMT)-like permease
VLLLSGGIFALAAINIAQAGVGRRLLVDALWLAFVTGLFTAAYTTYDAYGIRQTPDPFTFLAWFFVVDGLVFPWIALWRYSRMLAPPEPWPLLRRGVVGGLVAYVSFGSIMLATRIDKVGQAAVLRETSVVFAALIGWLILKERVGVLRGAMVVVIAVGAIVVEFG